MNFRDRLSLKENTKTGKRLNLQVNEYVKDVKKTKPLRKFFCNSVEIIINLVYVWR